MLSKTLLPLRAFQNVAPSKCGHVTAVSILDYYQACEHVYQFTAVHFKDKLVVNNWAAAKKELLLNSDAGKVIKHIKQLKSGDNEAESLIKYYQSNIDKMDYKAYKKSGQQS